MVARQLLPLAFLALAACGDSCVNDVVDETLSPDGAHRAVLFTRQCGGPSDATSRLSIIEPRDVLRGGGNALVVERGEAAAADWGGPWVGVEWLDTARLVVRHDAKGEVIETHDRVSDVAISFEAIDR